MKRTIQIGVKSVHRPKPDFSITLADSLPLHPEKAPECPALAQLVGRVAQFDASLQTYLELIRQNQILAIQVHQLQDESEALVGRVLRAQRQNEQLRLGREQLLQHNRTLYGRLGQGGPQLANSPFSIS